MYQQKSFLDHVRSFDMYINARKDLMKPTCIGAILTILTIILSIYLFLFEFSTYFNIERVSYMQTDYSNDSEQVLVNIDINFPSAPCGLLNIDMADQIGGHSVDVNTGTVHECWKISKDPQGKEIDKVSHNNRPGDRNQYYDLVKKQIEGNYGCRMKCEFYVPKVPGNFHIAAHPTNDLVSRLRGEKPDFKLNLTHNIINLSFGEIDSEKKEAAKQKYGEETLHPLALHPLNGVKYFEENKEQRLYEYYLHVIPTIIKRVNKKSLKFYQYTENQFVDKNPGNLPAVYFRMDVAPVYIKHGQFKPNIPNAIIHICAIFGGMFTLSGILSSFLIKLTRENAEPNVVKPVQTI